MLQSATISPVDTRSTVLPIIDISPLLSENLDDRKAVATHLDRACRDIGFLYLTGEQFDITLANNLYKVARQYFAQDIEKKMQHYIGNSVNHSGYVPVGEEQFSSGSYDIKEAYDINYDYQGNNLHFPLLGTTQWSNDNNFKTHVSHYYQHIKMIGNQLFCAFALALGLDEHYFSDHTAHAPSQLRLIHYPYDPSIKDAEGIGAHTDFECFTLLLPTAPGLQVLNKQGEWMDIPILPNTLVMNIGDMMEILSNGRYLATKHRVKKVKEERYSFPFFFSCDYDYVIAPLVDETPKYEPIMGGEHLFNQTAQIFNYIKQKIAANELILNNAKPLDSFGLKLPSHFVKDN